MILVVLIVTIILIAIIIIIIQIIVSGAIRIDSVSNTTHTEF